MRAAIFRNGDIVAGELADPVPGAGQVLVKTLACGICGSDLHAAKHGLRGIPRSELPPLRPLLARLYMIAPIAVLIWAFVSGYSAFLAAGIGMLLCVAVSWLNGLRPGAGGGLGWRRNDGVMGGRAIIEALEAGARDCVQLVAVCAAAGG